MIKASKIRRAKLKIKSTTYDSASDYYMNTYCYVQIRTLENPEAAVSMYKYEL